MSKPIPGFPGYKISSQGKVTGPNGKEVKARDDKDGYRRVDLYRDGDRFTRFVHTLVQRAYGGGGKPEVNHKDKNRKNNSAANLEGATRKENVRHQFGKKKK